jgi:hypothetical protein
MPDSVAGHHVFCKRLNFTRADDGLFAELETLTAAGFARFQEEGTIPVG